MTVREAREKKGMTQMELAVAADVALTTIARIENGKMEKTSVGNLLKVCNALGCDPASLFTRND